MFLRQQFSSKVKIYSLSVLCMLRSYLDGKCHCKTNVRATFFSKTRLVRGDLIQCVSLQSKFLLYVGGGGGRWTVT